MKLKSALLTAATTCFIALNVLNLAGCSSSDDEKGANTHLGGAAYQEQTRETSVTAGPSSTDGAGAGVGTGSGTGTGLGTTGSDTGVAGTSTDSSKEKQEPHKSDNKSE